MSTAAICFDEMEKSADRTLAVVLWAKHARNAISCALMLKITDRVLHHLVSALTYEHLNALRPEQATELTKTLQELHEQLRGVLVITDSKGLAENALYRGALLRIEESFVDLSDVIEDLLLGQSEEFKKLLSGSVQESKHAAGNLARM